MFNTKYSLIIKNIALCLSVLVTAFFTSYVFSFEEPSKNPPEGNATTTINVGGTAQEKWGGLVVNMAGKMLGAPEDYIGFIVATGTVGIGSSIDPSKGNPMLLEAGEYVVPKDTLHVRGTISARGIQNEEQVIGMFLVPSEYGGDAPVIEFNIRSDKAQTYQTKMLIDNKGNIGIGDYGNINNVNDKHLSCNNCRLEVKGAINITGPDPKILIDNVSGAAGQAIVSNGSKVEWTTIANPTIVCPPGYSAGASYCIQNDENIAGNKDWFTASDKCRQSGARLCSASEWYGYCTAKAPLNNLTDDYEWIDEFSRIDAAGVANAYSVGNGGCSKFSETQVSATRAFRCCRY